MRDSSFHASLFKSAMIFLCRPSAGNHTFRAGIPVLFFLFRRRAGGCEAVLAIYEGQKGGKENELGGN